MTEPRPLSDLPVIDPGMAEPHVKPPLGLRAEAIHDEEANAARIEEIRQAMGRYIAADKPFPYEWVEELNRRSIVPKDIPAGWYISNGGLRAVDVRVAAS